MGLNYSLQLIMSGVLNVTQVCCPFSCWTLVQSNQKQLIGVSTSIWTIDRFGRRPLLLWGSFCMFISHLIIAVLVGKFNHRWADHRGPGWVSVAFVCQDRFSGNNLRITRRTDIADTSILAALLHA